MTFCSPGRIVDASGSVGETGSHIHCPGVDFVWKSPWSIRVSPVGACGHFPLLCDRTVLQELMYGAASHKRSQPCLRPASRTRREIINV